VAHLIVNRVDPRRILLMTFSRRAAAESTRRAGRIYAQALGSSADVMTDALTWAGTFHAIGARLLREYAEQIGIDPAFTIHDRVDSADLMNLARHELGLSKTESRFPTKATCLAIYSRAVNAEMLLDDVLRGCFPWCAEWERPLRELFAAMASSVNGTPHALRPRKQSMGCAKPRRSGGRGGCWHGSGRRGGGGSRQPLPVGPSGVGSGRRSPPERGNVGFAAGRC
jgi:superfamily I DNA/RNA helicase